MPWPANAMRETTRKSWEAYWGHQRRTGYVNYTPEIIRAITELLDARGCRILEIGVGTGGNSVTLAKLGAASFVLDFSSQALAISSQTAARENLWLRAVQADARALPFEDGFFDLIFHQGFLEHFRDPNPLIWEQRRVLKHGGYLLVDVPQKFNLYTLHKHRLIREHCWEYGGWETEFSYGELCDLLRRCGFKRVYAYGRGYYPRLFYILRQLYKVEIRLFGRSVLPNGFWKRYHRFWLVFERGALGLHMLQCIGIVGQKDSDWPCQRG